MRHASQPRAWRRRVCVPADCRAQRHRLFEGSGRVAFRCIARTHRRPWRPRAPTARSGRHSAIPAIKVMDFQWPWGIAATIRWPRGQRPRRRAILVLIPVSSRNTILRSARDGPAARPDACARPRAPSARPRGSAHWRARFFLGLILRARSQSSIVDVGAVTSWTSCRRRDSSCSVRSGVASSAQNILAVRVETALARRPRV